MLCNVVVHLASYMVVVVVVVVVEGQKGGGGGSDVTTWEANLQPTKQKQKTNKTKKERLASSWCEHTGSRWSVTVPVHGPV